MKNKRITRMLLIATVIAMMIPGYTAFAASGNDGGPDAGILSTDTLSFRAQSSTKAIAQVYSQIGYEAESIKSVITLQSAPLGSTSFSTVPGVSPSTKTVYNEKSIYHTCDFPITSQKDYRIKISITDKLNGVTSTSIQYKKLSR